MFLQKMSLPEQIFFVDNEINDADRIVNAFTDYQQRVLIRSKDDQTFAHGHMYCYCFFSP